MKNARGVFRLLFFLGFVVVLIIWVRWLAFWNGMDMRRFLDIRRRWTRNCLLPTLGVRVSVLGTPPDFPCILMCNHRSYIDPAVISRDVPGFPVSKAEVANWPVIGTGARLTGVLYIKREDPQSRKHTRSAIGDKIREGFPVILFPEGTTHNRPQSIPFRPGAFAIAAAQEIPVVPVAIDFRNPQDYWLGADTFLPHFIQCFGKKYTDVVIRYGTAIRHHNPETLLRETQDSVDEFLAGIRRDFF